MWERQEPGHELITATYTTSPYAVSIFQLYFYGYKLNIQFRSVTRSPRLQAVTSWTASEIIGDNALVPTDFTQGR